MFNHENYLCWDPIIVPSSIATEAVSADPNIFLATHSPLRINRARLVGGTDIENTGITVREEEVLKDFLEADSTTGALLMPIVGGSGSGKSHLVRWVKLNVNLWAEENIPGKSYKIIYLEKFKTSLRAVINELTQDSESGVLADLRRDIDLFSEGTSESKLANDLLDQLASSLLHAVASKEDRNERTLLGEKGLQVLLHDPEIRGVMLTPGRFIPELARQLLQDKREGDADRPPEFSTTDLPIDIDERILAEATTQSKKLVRMLSVNAELQLAAVRLLNEHRGPAVKKAANLGGGRLGDAMRIVRREYKREGLEIILLIEDFALIQGVQGDLVDAILEPSTREGVESMAQIRTMMAVTTGYFHKMDDTVLTRIGATSAFMYNLDVTFDDSQSVELSTEFVGRYLNLVRLLSKNSSKTKAALEINACEGCKFKSKCQDGFGVSPKAHGLYPFNASALSRMIHSTAKGDPQRFTPRNVLSQVVIPILTTYAEDLRLGKFPAERFDHEFPISPIDEALPSEVASYIDRHDPENAGRRKSLTTFWGNGATEELNTDILRAFKLEPLDSIDDKSQPISSSKTSNVQISRLETPTNTLNDHENSTLPRSLEKQIVELEHWGTRRGSILANANTSRLIRGFIARTVSDSYLWSTPITKQLNQGDTKKFWRNLAGKPVSIEDANENARRGKNGPLHFDRTAENSLLFREIHLSAYENRAIAGRYNRRLASLADQHAESFSRELQKSRYSSEDMLVKGMVASLMGAALFGKVQPNTPVTEMISVLFDDGMSWNLQNLPVRVPNWQVAATQHHGGRTALIERLREAFGISVGTGAVMYLDVVRILPLLERARKTWIWEPPTEIPDWLAPAAKSLSQFPHIMTEQAGLLQQKISTIRKFAPRGVTWLNLVATVREALDATNEASLPVPSSVSVKLQQVLSGQIDVGWAEIIAIEDNMTRIEETAGNESNVYIRRVVACTQPHRVDFDTIINFLDTADSWLDSMLNDQSLSSVAEIVDATSREVLNAVNRWGLVVNPERSI